MRPRRTVPKEFFLFLLHDFLVTRLLKLSQTSGNHSESVFVRYRETTRDPHQHEACHFAN
jgi:hypothetical protein